MRKVFKYPLEAYEDIAPFTVGVMHDLEVRLPEGSQMLHIGLQGGKIMLWALVDPKSKLCARKILCVGTGHEVHADNLRYIDTIHLMDDSFILHFFEVLE